MFDSRRLRYIGSDVRRRAYDRMNLHAILEAAPDALLVVDDAGRVCLANEQAERLFGHERAALLGQPIELLIPERYRESHRDQRRRFAAAPRKRPMGGIELRCARRDGSEFPAEISLSPVVTAQGRFVVAAVRDVSERHTAEAQRAQLAAIVDWSDDAIISKDLRGIVTSWNRGAERLFGYTAEEMLGRSIEELWPRGQQAEVMRLIGRVARGEHFASYETVRRRKDGAPIDVSVTLSPILDGQGRVTGVSKVARDISDRKRAEMALAAAKDAAEAANRELEAFNYSVAHDLRAPLRHIDGFSRLMLEEHAAGLDEQARGHLHRIRDAAQRMREQIDGLLSLAQIGHGDIRRKRVDLSELAHTAARRLRAAEPEREVDLRIEAGLTAACDARLVLIVFDNLLGNAWKFTRTATRPSIEVGRDPHGSEGTIVVRDNGVGFDMAHAGKLFGVFQRLHHRDEFEGTGIGLATVQRIVQRHGGRIWAQARVGEGASFRFTLGASADSGTPVPAGD